MRRHGGRRQETIHTAEASLRRLGVRIVLDLHFVTAAQIDAAVRTRRHVELDVQLEILEFPIGQQFRAVTQAHQVGILDAPRDCSLGITQVPAGEVVAVEHM